uniref:Uncharacterized protein n=2 Tax=Aegilops tauschii subsp. strangulata TaxID=200361 RepID=A0A453GEM0_AEGTS
LMFVQYYWISGGAFIVVLLIPPLALLSLFLAGLDALFSRGPKRYPVPHISTLVILLLSLSSSIWICPKMYFCFAKQFNAT